MKKLAYISYDFFLDLDYPIVQELAKRYKLYWIVNMKVTSNPIFTIEEIIEYARENNIHLEIIKIITRYRSLRQLINDIKYTLWLKKIKADIYYFQEFSDPYLPILAKLFLNSKKVIVSIHDVVDHQKDTTLIIRLIKNFYTSSFKNYHIFSESQKNIFQQFHPKKKIMMARLCLKDFGQAKKNTSSKKIDFLFFGLIKYYKGVDYLINAANLLSKDCDKFTVTIAGYCEDFSYYKDIIQNSSNFNLIIKVIPKSEIASLFVNSDYLVLPYRDVTQSGPLMIAYNYNVPTISSDFPGFNEYISNGITGFLFEPNNYIDLYKVMKTILDQPIEKTEEMKKNLKLYVERELGLENIINQYINFFEEL